MVMAMTMALMCLKGLWLYWVGNFAFVLIYTLPWPVFQMQ